LVIGGIFIWPFIIPAIIEAVESPRANKKLEADFSRKALTSQIIAPFSSANGIIFTGLDSSCDDFSFMLLDQKNNASYELSTVHKIVKV